MNNYDDYLDRKHGEWIVKEYHEYFEFERKIKRIFTVCSFIFVATIGFLTYIWWG